MNFILEDIDKENVNIEEYAESLRRAKALADNEDIIYTLFNSKKLYGVEYNITCGTSEYADEFFITRICHHNNMEETITIEILNSKSAEINEKEEIMGGCIIGVDSTDNYKLGETVQTYTQIGNTDYWYREM